MTSQVAPRGREQRDRDDRGRNDRGRPDRGGRAVLGQGVFGVFGEMLVVGLVVSALALPLATLLPGLAAGSAHLGRAMSDRPSTMRDLAADVWLAIRGGWLYGLAVAALLTVLGWNVAVGLAGVIPGGTAIAAISAAMALAVVVVAGRSAAMWRPGAHWPRLIREAAEATRSDPAGSMLIAVALGVCAVVTWMYAPLALIAPGMFCFAATVVERRRHAAGQP